MQEAAKKALEDEKAEAWKLYWNIYGWSCIGGGYESTALMNTLSVADRKEVICMLYIRPETMHAAKNDKQKEKRRRIRRRKKEERRKKRKGK